MTQTEEIARGDAAKRMAEMEDDGWSVRQIAEGPKRPKIRGGTYHTVFVVFEWVGEQDNPEDA